MAHRRTGRVPHFPADLSGPRGVTRVVVGILHRIARAKLHGDRRSGIRCGAAVSPARGGQSRRGGQSGAAGQSGAGDQSDVGVVAAGEELALDAAEATGWAWLPFGVDPPATWRVSCHTPDDPPVVRAAFVEPPAPLEPD